MLKHCTLYLCRRQVGNEQTQTHPEAAVLLMMGMRPCCGGSLPEGPAAQHLSGLSHIRCATCSTQHLGSAARGRLVSVAGVHCLWRQAARCWQGSELSGCRERCRGPVCRKIELLLVQGCLCETMSPGLQAAQQPLLGWLCACPRLIRACGA